MFIKDKFSSRLSTPSNNTRIRDQEELFDVVHSKMLEDQLNVSAAPRGAASPHTAVYNSLHFTQRSGQGSVLVWLHYLLLHIEIT